MAVKKVVMSVELLVVERVLILVAMMVDL